MTKKSSMQNQNGNILIYILGAIFLLGILIVMVKGSSTPGSNIDRETLMIRVAEVQAYGQELERAVAYVMSNGYSEEDIRFAHPDANPGYGVITDTPTRQVFSTQGGGAKYRTPPDDIQTTTTNWIFNAENNVGTVGTECTSDSCVDLVALLMNVREDFCIEMNEQTGVENPAGVPPQDQNDFSYGTLFTGAYSHSNSINDATDSFILNNTEGCVQGGGDPSTTTFHYYRVLLGR
jgi:hypothetical protein